MIRSVLGRLVGAAFSLGAVAAVVLAPLAPAAPSPVEPVAVAVPAAPTDLVCPGPARLATEPEDGDDVVYDPQFDPEPVGSTTLVDVLSVERPADPAAAAEVRDLAGAALVELTPAGGVAQAVVEDPDTGLVAHAEAGTGGPAWLAGSSASWTTAGDLRGLAAADCRPAVAEAWLVGGATTLGSSARLVLANPGRTAAQVRIELFGAAGSIELAGATEYLVPAGSERVVLLEGAAAEQPRLVVHLTASGGLVAGYLQDSLLRGLTPAGVAAVVPGGAPAPTALVPGVVVAESDPDAPDAGVLRVLAPAEDGTARVRALGVDGAVDLAGAQDLALVAGEVLDVPLAGLPAGDWTLEVSADVDVVAAAMLTSGPDAGLAEPSPEAVLDRAWAASVTPGTVGPVALPAGASWRLVLAVAGGTDAADVQVDVVDDAGAAVTGTPVPAGRSVTLTGEDVDGRATGLVVRADDQRVVWAVVLTVPDDAGDLIGVLSPRGPTVRPDVVEVRLD